MYLKRFNAFCVFTMKAQIIAILYDVTGSTDVDGKKYGTFFTRVCLQNLCLANLGNVINGRQHFQF